MHIAAVVGTAHLVVEVDTGHSAVGVDIALADPSKPSVSAYYKQYSYTT